MLEPDTVISLGAGVQSTAMALMAARGELDELGPRPRLAIFADTGWEPRATYEHLERLELELAAGGIELARVSKGNLRDDAVAAAAGGGNRFASIPFYVTNPAGDEGALRRQCTREYKLEPIYRELRARGHKRVTLYLGITLDEVQRMKPARVQWARNAWPLIERRLTRHDCELWLERNGWGTVPKSACIGCPFHGDRQWRELRDERPDEWDDAVAFDAAIRRLPRVDGEVYLHRQRVPLDQVDLTTAEDLGQASLFDDECEGICGV